MLGKGGMAVKFEWSKVVVCAYEHCHAFGSSNFSNYPLIFRRGVKARRKRFAPGYAICAMSVI